MPLYSYCRSLLREPEDAADAVQDTFLIATAKLGGLRDPGKLRSWLYAVARNECYRRLRSGEATSALDEAVDMTAESADVASAVEQAELRQLVRDAIDGLNPASGTSSSSAWCTDWTVTNWPTRSGCPATTRTRCSPGPAASWSDPSARCWWRAPAAGACAALDALLAGWDGQMTVLMRKRVSRHIEQCETCGERKRRELSPALFGGALPLVALMPGFRERVLQMCHRPHARRAGASRERGGARGPVRPGRLPQPGTGPARPGWHRVITHSHALAASAARRPRRPGSARCWSSAAVPSQPTRPRPGPAAARVPG